MIVCVAKREGKHDFVQKVNEVQWEYVYCQEGLLMGFLEEKEYVLEKRKVKALGQKYLKGEKKIFGM